MPKVPLKTCSHCKGRKSLDAFGLSRPIKSWCKLCINAYSKTRRATLTKRPPAVNGKKRCTVCARTLRVTSFYAHPHGVLGRHADCKECANASVREARERDPARHVRSALAWQRANPERHLANQRRLYLKNRAKRIAVSVAWLKANPEWARANRIKFQARRRGMLIGSFTGKDWLALLKRYGPRCLCCGKKRKLTADHVVPVSRGGTNYIDNIQPLCMSCNSAKHTKTIDYRPAPR